MATGIYKAMIEAGWQLVNGAWKCPHNHTTIHKQMRETMKTCIHDRNYDREVKTPCGIVASHILTFHTGTQSPLCESHVKYANEKLGKMFIIKQKAI